MAAPTKRANAVVKPLPKESRPHKDRFLPVCFYHKAMISRQAAFGEMQSATERQELGGKLPIAVRPKNWWMRFADRFGAVFAGDVLPHSD